ADPTTRTHPGSTGGGAMRTVAVLIAGGVLGLPGCLAPFSWPAERRPAAETLTAPEDAMAVDHLSEAATRIDRGDDAGALPHLRAHVDAHPDAVMVRAYVAELLLRLDRLPESAAAFARVVADGQETDGPARGHLVHCHTRLMEIARQSDDRYAEELHRGIGLLLLVRKWDADPARRDDAAAERTLTKAAAALRAARDERPADPRANLYLADVYDRLGQPSAAAEARRAARDAGPDAALTAGERKGLAADGLR
ncbi:MAG: hypothetical protein ACRC7O_09665, partial [Fimbriiglobus sp.]